MEAPRVSVIIPVYNAEKYLRGCMDSVLGQSLRELEVICVDDGSTDGSAAILKEYAEKDSRVRVLHQENKGAGAARNLGIDAARGEYAAFIDADDSLCPDSLEPLYRQAERARADVIRSRAYDCDAQTGIRTESVHNALKRVPRFMFGKVLNYRRAYLLFPKVTVAPWGGLFRLEFLRKNGLRFNSLVCVNDRSFFWGCVLKAERTVFSGVYFINYRTNNDSSLIGSRIRNFDCHFKSYAHIYEMSRGLPPKMRRDLLSGEMLDIANWLEVGSGTEYGTQIIAETCKFIASMDTSPWDGHIERTKWYKRINLVREKK